MYNKKQEQRGFSDGYVEKRIEKTHTQHLLEAIAYNLYRAPGIIVANAKSKKIMSIRNSF